MTRRESIRSSCSFTVAPGLSSTRDFVWEQWPLAQMIAARGYVVFQPNYRGSDNLGNAYMTAIVGDTVAGPGDDIIAGLAALERTAGRRRLARRRMRLVLWRRVHVVADRTLPRLARRRFRRRGEQRVRRVQSLDVERAGSLSALEPRHTPATASGSIRENSPITYYAQITTPTLIWGTTLDPGRADHAVLRALSRAER